MSAQTSCAANGCRMDERDSAGSNRGRKRPNGVGAAAHRRYCAKGARATAGRPANGCSDVEHLLPKKTIQHRAALGRSVGVMNERAVRDSRAVAAEAVCAKNGDDDFCDMRKVANRMLARYGARRSRPTVRMAIGASQRAQIVTRRAGRKHRRSPSTAGSGNAGRHRTARRMLFARLVVSTSCRQHVPSRSL